MQSCGCSIDDYLELHTREKDELMTSPDFRGASDYGRNTYGTWDISMQKIDDMAKGIGREAVAGQTAIMLLRIFAFLDNANIPEELFKNSAQNFAKMNIKKKNDLPLLLNLLNHETLLLNEDGRWKRTKFLAGIQVLLSFSFIKAYNHLYSIHLLVHAWSRTRIPKFIAKDICHKARALLSCSIVRKTSIDNHSFWRLLVPHIKTNSLYMSEFGLKDMYHDDGHKNFAYVFDKVGNWNEAERLSLVAVKKRSAQLGADHPATLWSLELLAMTYWNQGRWAEAEKLDLNIMNARRAALGSDHPDTLQSMGSLASTYGKQGKWDEAEKLQVHVLNAGREKLGSDHLSTLRAMANLACTYWQQGRWGDAEKLQVAVMNARTNRLGSDHPHTLTSMAGLACTYREQGRLDEAEKLEVDVMNLRKAKLGSDHPGTLKSMTHLAYTYCYQGRFDEAESLFRDAVKKMQQVMGSQHPTTLHSMEWLDYVSNAKQKKKRKGKDVSQKS